MLENILPILESNNLIFQCISNEKKNISILCQTSIVNGGFDVMWWSIYLESLYFELQRIYFLNSISLPRNKKKLLSKVF